MDDNDANQALMAAMLRRWGFPVSHDDGNSVTASPTSQAADPGATGKTVRATLHDLRNAMTTINGLAETLIDHRSHMQATDLARYL